MTSGFFRLVLYFFIAYLVSLLLRFLFFRPRPRRSRGAPLRKSDVMVKDEACNTYLPREQAIHEKFDGRDTYFCSEECRQKFLAQRKGRA